MERGFEGITDDELLYRRIPAVWYSNTVLSDQAFAPHKTEDTSGLSVSRAKYKTIDEAAKGRPGKTYFVATLKAGDLRAVGIEIIPKPETQDGIDPAHAELPGLNSSVRKDAMTLKAQNSLVKCCLRIDGPYQTPE